MHHVFLIIVIQSDKVKTDSWTVEYQNDVRVCSTLFYIVCDNER